MLGVVVVTGLAAAATATALRRLGPFARAALAGTKPWSCDLCMSVWSVATWRTLAWLTASSVAPGEFALVSAASVAVSLGALSWLGALSPPPPPVGLRS